MKNKSEIERIATAIKQFLDNNFLNGDCRIYFNGICWRHGTGDSPFTWDKEKCAYIDDKPCRTEWKTIEDINPKDYFEYANGFISMSFEGELYDVLNGVTNFDFEMQEQFQNLLKGFGCYYELGNTWNLSIYEL